MFPSARKNDRLSQWDGRRHSSRREQSLLRRLGQRAVLLRLAVVFATTLLVTLLSFLCGLPFPYREGQTWDHDIKARIAFDVGDPSRPEETLLPERIPRGSILVAQGQPIQRRQHEFLLVEHRTFMAQIAAGDLAARTVAEFLVFLLLAGSVVLYTVRFQPSLADNLPMIAGVCILVLLTVSLGLALSAPPWHAVILPLTMTAMILTLAYNPQFALMMAFSLVLAMAVILGHGLAHFLIHTGGLATAILLLRNVRTRMQLVKVATVAGLAFASMTFASGLLANQPCPLILGDALRHCVWGSLAGFLLTGLLPVVERSFGIVTDIRLLELADGSHPLLQELVKRAPGTYTHSITVATLAESAAEAVDANPLLVRVGSYFHDIGKMLKPHYFVENQSGENRHDALEPALSTLVIIGHVKDGLALAEEYRLPSPIVDFIAQHHGTTLVEYFYREALKLQQQAGLANTDLEACFRYPGPKPLTKEIGLVMLADAVESTSRSLANPTPASLQKLVHDLLMKRLLDGQFEECGLTLTELHRIEESLSKSLTALFHARIKYPDDHHLKAA
ncbi:MAG: HDIG domain-containing metalloprotein [Planctomycetota bacterium]